MTGGEQIGPFLFQIKGSCITSHRRYLSTGKVPPPRCLGRRVPQSGEGGSERGCPGTARGSAGLRPSSGAGERGGAAAAAPGPAPHGADAAAKCRRPRRFLPPQRPLLPGRARRGRARRRRYLLGAGGVRLCPLPFLWRRRRSRLGFLGPAVCGGQLGRLFPASRGGAHPLLPPRLRRLGLRVGLPGGVAVLHRGGLLEADPAQQAAHRAGQGRARRRRAARRPRRPRGGSGRGLPTAAAWRGGAAAGAAPPPGPSPRTGAGRSWRLREFHRRHARPVPRPPRTTQPCRRALAVPDSGTAGRPSDARRRPGQRSPGRGTPEPPADGAAGLGRPRGSPRPR